MLRAGDLIHRVKIQAPASGLDSQGGPSPDYTDVSGLTSVPARVLDLQGRELFSAQQINAETSVKVRLRYLSALTAKHRIVFGARLFDVASVANPDGKRVETVALCVERPVSQVESA